MGTSATGVGNQLQEYINNGEKLGKASELFGKLGSKTGNPYFTGISSSLNKVSGILGSTNNALDKIAEVRNTIGKYLDPNAYLGMLTGLTGNAAGFLKNLAATYGFSSDLFDSFGFDIFDSILVGALSFVQDAVMDLMLDKLGLDDKSIEALDNSLKILCIGLMKAGGDPNYNDMLLSVCMKCDLAKTLEWLDDYNSTDYNLKGNEYLRGFRAARDGCHRIAYYIAKKLYSKYKSYANGTVTDNIGEAQRYKDQIIKLFKDAFVYSYSDYGVDDLEKWTSAFRPIFIPSMFGTNNTDTNRQYTITSSDINTIAPIIKIPAINSDSMPVKMNFKTGFTSTSTKFLELNDQIIQYEELIDVRNEHAKELYVILAHKLDFTKDELMINKPYHDRLKYKIYTSAKKAQDAALSFLSQSKFLNDWSKFVEADRALIYTTLKLMANKGVFARCNPSYMSSLHHNIRDMSIPQLAEFKDSASDIRLVYHANYDSSAATEEHKIPYGIDTQLPYPNLKRNGWHIEGWALQAGSTTISYKVDQTVSLVQSTIHLYAVWAIGDPTNQPSNPNNGSRPDNTNTSVSEEDIQKKKDELADECLDFSYIFDDSSITHRNFDIIDITNYTQAELTSIITRFIKEHPTFVQIDTLNIKRWSPVDEAYTKQESYLIFSDKKLEYESLTSRNKTQLKYMIFAKYLISEFTRNYTLEAMKGWYGETEFVTVRLKDQNGNDITDPSGKYITYEQKGSSKRDEQLAEVLESMRLYYNQLQQYYSTIDRFNTYTVTFNNCGHGQEVKSITGIAAYSTISFYEPKELIEEGFMFKGWYIEPECYNKWIWEADIVTHDTTLYAKWTKVNLYITMVTLPQNINSNLSSTVVATVDEKNQKIHIDLHNSELDENDTYKIYIELPEGISSSFTNGSSINLQRSPSNIMIKDPSGKSKTYVFELDIIADDYRRISYISYGGHLDSIVGKTSYKHIDGLVNLPNVVYTDYTFGGWYSDPTYNGGVRSYIEPLSKDVVLYAFFEIKEIKITYRSRGNLAFAGVHGPNYVTSCKINQSYSLDTPTRDNYVFVGYYEDINCIKRVPFIPAYTYDEDLTLYAYWMEQSEYDALFGDFNINGVHINLREMTFYKSILLASQLRWEITETGLALYSSTGEKIQSFAGKIGNKNNVALGIAFIKSPDGNMIYIVACRNSADGRILVYYTLDSGSSWTYLTECTTLELNFFDGTGVENVANLTYFKRVMYNAVLYVVNGSNVEVLGMPIITEDTISHLGIHGHVGKPIEGICITADATMYILYDSFGVIAVKNFEPSIEKDDQGNVTVKPNPNIEAKGVAGWTDGMFNVDNESTGSPQKAASSNPKINDDFDIDDNDTIRNILSYYGSGYRELMTWQNASGDPQDTSTDLWQWGFTWDENLHIWSGRAVLLNIGAEPSTQREKLQMILMRKSSGMVRELGENVQLDQWREVTITKQNSRYYIGWTRKISEGTEVFVTEEMIVSEGIDKFYPDQTTVWVLKYTRSEVYDKVLPSGETVSIYKEPEYSESESFYMYKNENQSNNNMDLVFSKIQEEARQAILEELRQEGKDVNSPFYSSITKTTT